MRVFKGLKKNIIATSIIETPIGDMFAAASNKGIVMLSFYDKFNIDAQIEKLKKRFDADILPAQNKYFSQLQEQINEYFNKERTTFDVPLQLVGTPFQMSVWKELLTIPYGTTLSYKEQAEHINKPTAYRAVANANGQNMLMILVPCHRVIGSDGKLNGYAGGIEKKEYLHHLEKN